MRRVFTQDEQARIGRACRPDLLLWALWAGKETAYKIAVKIRPGIPSIPRLYEVDCPADLDGDTAGAVTTPAGSISIRLFSTSRYIHCIGVAGPTAPIRDVVSAVDHLGGRGEPAAGQESRAVREAAGKRLALHFQVPPGAIEIRRHEGSSGLGPPRVYCRGVCTDMDISLSHDGRFTAYAFLPII